MRSALFAATVGVLVLLYAIGQPGTQYALDLAAGVCFIEAARRTALALP